MQSFRRYDVLTVLSLEFSNHIIISFSNHIIAQSTEEVFNENTNKKNICKEAVEQPGTCNMVAGKL